VPRRQKELQGLQSGRQEESDEAEQEKTCRSGPARHEPQHTGNPERYEEANIAEYIPAPRNSIRITQEITHTTKRNIL